MGGFLKGYEHHEEFMLPGDWVILIDYGMEVSPAEVSWGYEKGRSAYMRSKLYKQGILVDESIEDNPNFVTYEDARKIKNQGKFVGEEFERVIHFPNGYVAKIEYWFSKEKQNPNLGNYDSKYRRLILFNEFNKVISEIIEENPRYISPEELNFINNPPDEFKMLF